jgi:hypothetical protein
MTAPIDPPPLTSRERMLVVGMSLAVVAVFAALLGIVWWQSPWPGKEWLRDEFWEMVGVGRRRVPKGFVAIWTIAAYAVVFPVVVLVFAGGAVQGFRSGRTRLTTWILHEVKKGADRDEIEKRG